MKAVNSAINGAGGIALQFPLYGGIQGIMVGSGLAAIIAKWFISFATAKSFPVLTFLAILAILLRGVLWIVSYKLFINSEIVLFGLLETSLRKSKKPLFKDFVLGLSP